MIMSRRLATLATLSPLAGLALTRQASAAIAKTTHKVAVHVNYKDPVAQGLALNNVQNMYEYFASKGEKLEVRIVAHGPGLHMFRDDTSTVKDRLASMKKASSTLSFAACANTKSKMEKDEGKTVPLISQAEIVPSGVVELVLLEEKGWTYLRP
jgi:intracellular sulfur oxidation DsrE/DsrF family protein